MEVSDTHTSVVEVSDLDNYHLFLQTVPGSSSLDEVYVTSRIVLSGITYRSSMFITTSLDKENGHPIFGEIKYVIIIGGSSFYFHGRVWPCQYFSQHYHAYSVKHSSPASHFFVQYEELTDVEPFHKIKETLLP